VQIKFRPNLEEFGLDVILTKEEYQVVPEEVSNEYWEVYLLKMVTQRVECLKKGIFLRIDSFAKIGDDAGFRVRVYTSPFIILKGGYEGQLSMLKEFDIGDVDKSSFIDRLVSDLRLAKSHVSEEEVPLRVGCLVKYLNIGSQQVGEHIVNSSTLEFWEGVERFNDEIKLLGFYKVEFKDDISVIQESGLELLSSDLRTCVVENLKRSEGSVKDEMLNMIIGMVSPRFGVPGDIVKVLELKQVDLAVKFLSEFVFFMHFFRGELVTPIEHTWKMFFAINSVLIREQFKRGLVD